MQNLTDIIFLILKVIIQKSATHLFNRHLFSSYCMAAGGIGTENTMLNEHISESEGCLQPEEGKVQREEKSEYVSSTAGTVGPAAGVNAVEGKSQQVPGGLESGIGLGNRDREGVGRRSGKGPPESLLRDSTIREGECV